MIDAKGAAVPARLAYRIGDKLPRVLKIMYYIVLFTTFIYLIYRFLEWVLKTIQKIGAFVFEPRNYWAAVLSLFILVIGAFIIAQFALGLDPWGNFIKWVVSTFENIAGGITQYGRA